MTTPQIIAAVAVPFTDAGGIDLEAFRDNLQRLQPLLDGVLVAGTTGEFPALEDDERLALFEAALKIFGPERAIAHTGAASARQAVRLTHRAHDLGVARFAAITPYYLPSTVNGTAAYYSAVREATVEGALYAYIFPDVAGTDVSPDDLPRIVSAGIDGAKLSGQASTRFRDYAQHAPSGFAMWSGNDADVPNVLDAGGLGTVSGVACAVPQPWADLREAYRDGDELGIAAAQERISSLVAVLGPSIANLKHALRLQGLGGTNCRMSIDAPSPDVCAQIAHLLSA